MEYTRTTFWLENFFLLSWNVEQNCRNRLCTKNHTENYSRNVNSTVRMTDGSTVATISFSSWYLISKPFSGRNLTTFSAWKIYFSKCDSFYRFLFEILFQLYFNRKFPIFKTASVNHSNIQIMIYICLQWIVIFNKLFTIRFFSVSSK